MGVIVQPHVEYTMAEDKYARIAKRVSALRRATLYTLLGKLEGKTFPETKGDAITQILENEFGTTTMEAYYAVKAQKQARKPRRRRGQLLLPLL